MYCLRSGLSVRLKCLKADTILKNNFASKKNLILGIETSCDDTGCAVLDLDGNILGEALHSQHLTHLNNGGIIPPIAQDMHRKNIENVVNTALTQAQVNVADISAIATTIKPGLPMSLIIGLKYGKHLCKVHDKPFIPIHHMKAHALTARMFDRSIEFPFLVLLVSGGHCLLAVAKNIEDFLLLGESLDDAPGEAFDKMARRMKLKNLPEYSELSGGQAIELAASKADNPLQYEFTIPLLHYRDCNFSLAGIKNQVKRKLLAEEKLYDVPPDGIIPGINNICAGFQLVVTKHLCHRIQRAIEFVSLRNIIPPENRTLVVSGGVACNNYLMEGIKLVCEECGYKVVRPPPKLCTDNGVMIAWNGVERFKANVGVYENFEHIDLEGSSPIGQSMIEEVTKENISCKWVKLTKLTKPNSVTNLKREIHSTN